MATMANWNGHTFEVSPRLIRGYTELNIKGSCETTTKNSDKQKYVEHKYGEIPELTLTIHLNALTGVTDVYGEAMEYVQEATDGACAYFYLGGKKLLPGQMMLTQAEITEIASMPGDGGRWISCDVKVKFQQGGKNDGSSSSGSATGGNVGGTKKATVDKETADATAAAPLEGAKTAVSTGLNALKTLVDAARAASAKDKLGEIDAVTQAAPMANRAAQINKDSAGKVTATTGRSLETAKKLARRAADNLKNNK